ncbi:lysozyme inhibitor LprI family protein [Rhizobium sp. C1]|uniref:lysozyme inhibitor LprI family protein n=1 Tax=Rhizobium sp. C1 TaxID=1349799 RepID=UPI001E492F05|nr:lysozyme inhibitor LprI family protein [Rhizobium sp. C1]MCD2176423.1 hypothetical protein [Rhizobium sp. C1]
MNLMIRAGLISCLLLSGQAASAAALPQGSSDTKVKPSFDCSTAEHAIEELVCEDPELADLDVQLASVFQSALKKVEAMPNTAPEIRHMKAYQLRWSRERNACAKSEDVKACTLDSYHRRIADLQARFLLVKTKSPAIYTCRGNPKNQLIVTYVESAPPSVRLDHAGKTAVAFQDDETDEKRFVGPKGISFEVEGDMALINWPKGNEFDCILRK